ncbi:MAG: mechanosensitive ion channel family protein, partial [Atribacterota bacterium]
MVNNIIIPASILAGFILIGIIIQKIISKYISKFADITQFKWDDIIIESIKSFVVFWFFLIGLRIALKFISLKQAYIEIASKTIIIIFIFTFTLFLTKLVSMIAKNYSENEKGSLRSTTIFSNLLKLFILIIGIMIIMQSLGIKITPMITALGIGGLAVALALQDTLSNLFAGLHIIFAGQIRVGDFVKLDSGQKGVVTDITWRNSTIRTRGNNIVVIPNSKLSQAIVVNYYLKKKAMRVLVPVGVSYDSDLDKVEKVTVEVAKDVMENVDGGVPKFEPKVRFHTFNDFSIDMNVILRAKEYDKKYKVQHEFVKRLHKRYNEKGIVIPFPIRT